MNFRLIPTFDNLLNLTICMDFRLNPLKGNESRNLISKYSSTLAITETVNQLASGIDEENDKHAETEGVPQLHSASKKAFFSAWRRLRPAWTWFNTDSWALEGLALAVSVATVVTILVMLATYNGCPITDWNYAVAPSSLLSILSTLLQGTVTFVMGSSLGQLKWIWHHQRKRVLYHFQLFDGASRGPMGSTSFLLSLPCLSLATVGCIVTLLVLAAGPVIQQSLDISVRQVNNSTATIPFSQSYKKYSSFQQGNFDIDPAMKSAIYDGAFLSNISQTSASISSQCSTGNCNFPKFTTLAVSSQCVDTSALIREDCVANDGGSCANFTLPNGLSIGSKEDENFIAVLSNPSLNTNELWTHQPSLVNISILVYDAEVTNLGHGYTGYNLTRLLAFDCVFYACAHTYEAKVSQGQLVEKIIHTYPINTPVENPYDANLTLDDLTYEFDYRPMGALRHFLSKHINGTGSMDKRFKTEIIQALFVNGANKVPRTIENISKTVSNHMRVSSGQVHQGTAMSDETYIRVQWPWLVLPLIIVVLDAIVLGLTMWQSSALGIPKWRNSVLAAMVHGVDKSEKERYVVGASSWVGKEKVSQLDEWAESLGVRLRPRRSTDLDYGLVRAA